jgi:Zn-dependent protease
MSRDPIIACLWIAAFVVCITIHEFGHAVAAKMMGDDTPELQGRISLNPLDHLDPVGTMLVVVCAFFSGGICFGWGKPVQVNPANFKSVRWGDLFVSLAGPLMNLLMAALIALAVRLGAVSNDGSLFFQLVEIAFSLNLVLFLFNLLPVYPLDGSHILAALLPSELAYKYVRFMSSWGMFAFCAVWFFGSAIILPPLTFLSNILLGMPK